MTLPDSVADRLNKRLPPDIRDVARQAGRIAEEKGTRAALVGGVVRDLMLERPILDADIMIEPPSSAVAEELARRIGGRLTPHAPFLTYNLHLPDGRKIDLVTAREENYPKPAVLPVVRPATFEKDLKRRDFGINAIVCLLGKSEGTIFDPLNGRADMEKRIVRALHEKSFIDDPTRIYRAARFAGRLGFSVEPATEQWILSAIRDKGPERLSPVRRRHEFEMVLKEPSPGAALKILQRWKALDFLGEGWNAAPVDAVDFGAAPQDGSDALARRLTAWLLPFGKDAAGRMMNALQFERTMKKNVLTRFGGG
ncbi:MAG: CCA tRNA nucleotidyltransferase [Elusimicrobia bacterium]|nr:CCA tRNA nucleotidyltransferase [Elusimicrobiota bacterium]